METSEDNDMDRIFHAANCAPEPRSSHPPGSLVVPVCAVLIWGQGMRSDWAGLSALGG